VPVAELRDFFWKIADLFRVIRRKALYRRRDGIRGRPGGPHQPLAWPGGGRATPVVVALRPPSGSPSVFVLRPGNIGGSAFVSSNSENISCVAFLKHKKAENRELTLWHLVNRLVPENA
jgi:hypothetical protein